MLITDENKRAISPYVRDQLPQYIRENESLFADFIVAFYQWLEVEGNNTERISNLLEYKDVSKTIDEYFKFLRDTYMVRVPKNILSDERLLVRNIRDFYQSRGSVESYRFFLRVLSGNDATITFPKDNILRVSGGFWYAENSLYVSGNDPKIRNILSTKIKGSASGASAVVNFVEVFNIGPHTVAKIGIESKIGDFLVDEIIETSETPVKIRAQVLSCVVATDIEFGGSGYIKGTNIPLFTSGDGLDFAAQISEVDENGSITKIEILNRGANYYTAPTGDFVSINTNTVVTSENLARVTFKTGALYTPGGVYYDSRSLISSKSVIEDNKKFQEYSYVIRSTLAIADYKEYVLKILHPAGVYLSAEVVLGTNENAYEVGVSDDPDHYYTLIIEPIFLDHFGELDPMVFEQLLNYPYVLIDQNASPDVEQEILVLLGIDSKTIDKTDIHSIGDYDEQRTDVFDVYTFQQYVNYYGYFEDEFIIYQVRSDTTLIKADNTTYKADATTVTI